MSSEPFTFVILGATGDLAKRKLFPALYGLVRRHSLTGHFLAVGRDPELHSEGFRQLLQAALVSSGVEAEGLRQWLETDVSYFGVGDGQAEDYGRLAARLHSIEADHDLTGNRVFYLAIPPSAYPAAIEQLGANGLKSNRGWTRLVVEKPFGHDLASARALNTLTLRHFEESQVYRIDHYLGKETVQNLLVLRFANALFESVWNRDRIERVEVTVAESLGVEARAGYYDHAGALRDMLQNHVTQLLTLLAMEAPAAFDADAIRYEKVKLLRSVVPPTVSDAVFGQYLRGSIHGSEVPGYREEPGVAADSSTETFAAVRLNIANWRWQGVPFILRTGKRLPRRVTRIAVVFRCPPVSIFKPFDDCSIQSNTLLLTLQPDEGFDLSFEVKPPGEPFRLSTQQLHFRYAEAFRPLPEAYEALLLDVIQGDQTLFVRADEAEAAWRLYAPLLEHPPELAQYVAGSWGPKLADGLLGADWASR